MACMTDEIFISNSEMGAPGAVAPGAGRTRTAVEFNRGATWPALMLKNKLNCEIHHEEQRNVTTLSGSSC